MKPGAIRKFSIFQVLFALFGVFWLVCGVLAAISTRWTVAAVCAALAAWILVFVYALPPHVTSRSSFARWMTDRERDTPKRRRLMAVSWACLAIACILIGLEATYIVMVIVGGVVLVGAILLGFTSRSRPALPVEELVTPTALKIRTLSGTGDIPWSAIQRVRIVRTGPYDCLDLWTTGEGHVSRWTRLVTGANRRFGYAKGDVLLRLPRNVDAEAVRNEIERRIDRPPPSPG
jgi:hypothetical protein